MGGGRDPGPVDPTQRGCSPPNSHLPFLGLSLSFTLSFCLSLFLLWSIQFCLFIFVLFFVTFCLSDLSLSLSLSLRVSPSLLVPFSWPQRQDRHPASTPPRRTGALARLEG